MSGELARFWELLETNFPLGGPRGHLRELLGTETVDALESAGVFKHRRVAERYPCGRSGGDGCPRMVIGREDGTIVAVCGNTPAQCADLDLSASDVALLAISPGDLCEKIGKALGIRAAFEELPGLLNAYRVGTFIPAPGVKHAIYLVVRCSQRDLAEAVNALYSQTPTQTLALLVPTERFVTDGLGQQSAGAGVPLVALVDAVGLGATGLCALGDPLKLFVGIGQKGVVASRTGPVVARALVKAKAAPTRMWLDLDDAAYRTLVASAGSYDIFADSLTRTVAKGLDAQRSKIIGVAASHFKLIRSAVEKVSNYDPGVADEEGDSAKQIFQRARKALDIKTGNSWALFKTAKVDNHAVYHFDPDASVTFALIFSPKP